LAMTVKEADLSSRLSAAGAKLGLAGAKHAELLRKLGKLTPKPDEKVAIANAAAELRAATLQYQRMIGSIQSMFGTAAANAEKKIAVPDVAQLQGSLRDLKAQTGQTSVAVFQLVGDD